MLTNNSHPFNRTLTASIVMAQARSILAQNTNNGTHPAPNMIPATGFPIRHPIAIGTNIIPIRVPYDSESEDRLETMLGTNDMSGLEKNP